MIIPPIRWGDILLRSTDERSIVLTEREQYALMMLLSLAQMNSELFISDYNVPDSEDIHQFLDETMNSLFDEDIPPLTIQPQIALFTINATPLAGVGTLSYNANVSLPFGYTMFTQNVALYGMEQPVWLLEGEYSYEGWCTQNSVAGNAAVAITDSGGVVDTIIAAFSQVGTFGVRVQKTGTFTIPTTGFYKIVAGNVSPVSGNHFCNWISHHIRKIS